jgi:hypothetical protein
LKLSTFDAGFQTPENNGPWPKRINIGDRIPEKNQLIAQSKNQAILEMRINKGLKNMIKGSIGVNMYRKLYRWVYNLR